MFENRVLGNKNFTPKWTETAGQWRRNHNEGLRFPPYQILFQCSIKEEVMGRKCVAYKEAHRNSYRVLVGKFYGGKTTLKP